MRDAIVELNGVEKDYVSGDGALTVLKRVDLRIGRGEFVGIVGASGSGKTTLMNILGCLDRPTRGRYVLDGEDVSGLDDDRLSSVRNKSIGFVFQSFNLISQFTVLENVEVPLFYARLPRRERRRRALAMIESVGLQHRVGHQPAQLSGGECQRVAIARALVVEPALLLADEPSGSLDAVTGDAVDRLLFDLVERRGTALVLVTHSDRLAAACDRRLALEGGRLVG